MISFARRGTRNPEIVAIWAAVLLDAVLVFAFALSSAAGQKTTVERIPVEIVRFRPTSLDASNSENVEPPWERQPVALSLHPAQVSAVSDEPISLALRADLSVVLGNRVIAREYLAQELETATGGNKNTQIFLRVDPEVSYADFSKLLGPLHAAGYGRISIVTPAVASAPPPNPVSPDNITDEKAALAREFAALTPAPKVAIATEAKPSATGGECHANPYLCTLFGLIMRQQHYPDEAKAQHIEGTVAVAFWVDDRGNLMHLALYRTSGHPILDDEAVASIRRAAPFPPPPPGIPHGFISQMQFPPK